MSDLAKDLLTQYYGIGAGACAQKFLSIHQSVQKAKIQEEKQVTEQASLTTIKDNVSDEKSQTGNDEYRKISIPNESQPSLVLDEILEDETFYETDENSDVLDISLGPNILCNTFENTRSSASREGSPDNAILDDNETKIEDPDVETNETKDVIENDPSFTRIEGTFPDNISEASSATLKTSRRSSRNGITLPPLVPKKVPVCNLTFADFSDTGLQQFPTEILTNLWQLRMLYLSNNNLLELPEDVFVYLRRLEWLDVRNNQLSSLPGTIKWHPCLETILLQGNRMESLPLELCTLPKLRTLQVAQNPLIVPPKDVVALGCAAILEFLRIEWNNAHPEERIEPKENKIEKKLSTILCYQSPRKDKKKLAPLQNAVHNRNVSTREKRMSYKPGNRCENKGPNVSMERRLLWFSRLKELLTKETSMLQKMKDEEVLKEWRRDKRSYSKAIEKAMKRSEDDIPFGFDVENYGSVFKQNSKQRKLGSRKRDKKKFVPPTDINETINELLESLNKLEINTTDKTTPRTKQNLFKNEIEKLLQFQGEIQNLRKYNDVAMVQSRN